MLYNSGNSFNKLLELNKKTVKGALWRGLGVLVRGIAVVDVSDASRLQVVPRPTMLSPRSTVRCQSKVRRRRQAAVTVYWHLATDRRRPYFGLSWSHTYIFVYYTEWQNASAQDQKTSKKIRIKARE